MQYMEPLKQSVGDFGELAQKKLTETMYQLLHEKTLSGETITLTAPKSVSFSRKQREEHEVKANDLGEYGCGRQYGYYFQSTLAKGAT